MADLASGGITCAPGAGGAAGPPPGPAAAGDAAGAPLDMAGAIDTLFDVNGTYSFTLNKWPAPAILRMAPPVPRAVPWVSMPASRVSVRPPTPVLQAIELALSDAEPSRRASVKK